MELSKPPRVFISYSWESEDHKKWVRYLAERLYAAGIEARLDQWFVQPGESFTAFMEQEVEAADFVLIVCTPSYARKSNKRQGGVRNVSITLRHFGEKFRLQEEAQRPLPTAAVGG
jgi:hypothetical protein